MRLAVKVVSPSDTCRQSGSRGTWRLVVRVPSKRSESLMRLVPRVLRQQYRGAKMFCLL